MPNDPYSLYSIVIELGAAEKGFPTGILGRSLHSQVLQWFKQDNPFLATELHQSQISPFSISPLMGKRHAKLTKAGDRLFFRICLLRGDLLQPLLNGIEQTVNQSVCLDKFRFRLCQTHILPGSHPLAGASHYSLISQTPVSSKITLDFKSSTSFKVDRKIIQVFPLGEHVFNSLLRRWNNFAPEDLHFSQVDWSIPIAAFDVKTIPIHLKKVEIGAQGWVTYIFPNTEQAKIASVLSEFAFFFRGWQKNNYGYGTSTS